MLRKLCNYPGCKAISEDGNSRCKLHRGSRFFSSKNINYSASERARFYRTNKWKRLSLRKRMETPFCEECYSRGRFVGVQLVDHIIEYGDEPAKGLLFSNLQSLCSNCHNEKTAKAYQARKHGNLEKFYRDYLNHVAMRKKPKAHRRHEIK